MGSGSHPDWWNILGDSEEASLTVYGRVTAGTLGPLSAVASAALGPP